MPTSHWIETQPHLGFVVTELKIASALGVAILPEEDTRQTMRDALRAVALRTSLGEIRSFFDYAGPEERGLAEIRRVLIKDLAGKTEKLTEVAFRDALDELAVFLRYSKSPNRGLSAVRRELIRDLAGKSEELLKLALRTPLDKLTFSNTPNPKEAACRRSAANSSRILLGRS